MDVSMTFVVDVTSTDVSDKMSGSSTNAIPRAAIKGGCAIVVDSFRPVERELFFVTLLTPWWSQEVTGPQSA